MCAHDASARRQHAIARACRATVRSRAEQHGWLSRQSSEWPNEWLYLPPKPHVGARAALSQPTRCTGATRDRAPRVPRAAVLQPAARPSQRTRACGGTTARTNVVASRSVAAEGCTGWVPTRPVRQATQPLPLDLISHWSTPLCRSFVVLAHAHLQATLAPIESWDRPLHVQTFKSARARLIAVLFFVSAL